MAAYDEILKIYAKIIFLFYIYKYFYNKIKIVIYTLQFIYLFIVK